MKVLHVITGLGIGGAEMALYQLLSRIDRTEFHSSVVSLIRPGKMGVRIQELGIEVRSLNMPPGSPRPGALIRLRRMLRCEKPRIVQGWMYHANLLALLASMGWRPGKVFWNIRSSRMEMSHYRFLSAWTVRVSAPLSRYVDVAVINSLAGRRDHMRMGFRPRAWAYVPNGIDTDRFCPNEAMRERVRAELGIAPDHFVIGMVARYDAKKDHGNFLRAASLLVRKHPGARFVLCGRKVEWDNTALSALISELGLGRHVILLGEQEDTRRIYLALDIHTSASAFGEGFPTVVAEAMACGVPCVVTRVGDSPQVVGVTGVVVEPRNSDDLVRGWSRLIAMSREERLRLGKDARARIERLYSLSRMIRRYEQLYRIHGNEDGPIYQTEGLDR